MAGALVAGCSGGNAGNGHSDDDSPEQRLDAGQTPAPDAKDDDDETAHAEGGTDGHSESPVTAPNDSLAAAACAAFGGSSAAVTMKSIHAVLAASETEVAEASLMVDGSTAYTIQLPVGKPSWVSLVQEHWDATVAFFAPKGLNYELINAANEPLFETPLPNAACADKDLTDYRVKFQHWSLATIKFPAEGPREVFFMVVKQPQAE